MKFEKKSLKFLEEYLNTASPTGMEHAGQKVWMDYLRPYVDELHSDHYGTCYGVINPEAQFKVVIEAHADEISWYVNYITDEGLIYVIRNGGSDQMIAPSKVVHIHGEKGIVKGLFRMAGHPHPWRQFQRAGSQTGKHIHRRGSHFQGRGRKFRGVCRMHDHLSGRVF